MELIRLFYPTKQVRGFLVPKVPYNNVARDQSSVANTFWPDGKKEILRAKFNTPR